MRGGRGWPVPGAGRGQGKRESSARSPPAPFRMLGCPFAGLWWRNKRGRVRGSRGKKKKKKRRESSRFSGVPYKRPVVKPCPPARRISFLFPLFPCFFKLFRSSPPCQPRSPGAASPKTGFFFFFYFGISPAGMAPGWPHKDGQMDTWRPWCGGGDAGRELPGFMGLWDALCCL